MKKYYLFGSKQSYTNVASAYAPSGAKLAQELIEDLENKYELPFELNMVKLTIGKNSIEESDDLNGIETIWLDYLPNSFAWPLFSNRLKSIISNHLTGQENIDWISAKINTLSEQKEYYIPRFRDKLDVLDKENSTYIPDTDHIIKPCFSLFKISQYSIFHFPLDSNLWKITSILYISDELKKILQKEKISGVCFDKANLA